ncbi:BA75_02326T0 [Komagataella pastoris]|uniref:Autophagy-related protein 13 n=1 Tax=Komagataella pastoris TaxID=4922 RepID=A0A1B2JBD3_PICPA|nr:BA75_02326T0 [Komagataella pastoris]
MSKTTSTAKGRPKLVQSVNGFFSKGATVVTHGRFFSSEPSKREDSGLDFDKPNKWFNLLVPELSSSAKIALSRWKGNDLLTIPPMVLEVFLVVPTEHSDSLVLRGGADGLSQEDVVINISNYERNEIVLERWLLEFDLTTLDKNSTEIYGIYKKMIILFRNLYTFVRLMPAFRLFQEGNWKIGTRTLDGSEPISSKDRIGLSDSFLGESKNSEDQDQSQCYYSHLSQKKFRSITTSMGSLKISCSFRRNTAFRWASTRRRTRDNTVTGGVSRAVGIQPFKTGVLSSSPGRSPSHGLNAALCARTESQPIPLQIHHRSSSNASLVQLLRNPRNSIPTSINSVLEDHSTISPATKFSSSFRLARRGSLHSRTSVDRRSSDLSSSDIDPDQFYVDDDINDLMRMIDARPNLRLSSARSRETSPSSLNRFQLLQKTHDILSDSVNASLPTSAHGALSMSPSRRYSMSPPTMGPGSSTASISQSLTYARIDHQDSAQSANSIRDILQSSSRRNSSSNRQGSGQSPRPGTILGLPSGLGSGDSAISDDAPKEHVYEEHAIIDDDEEEEDMITQRNLNHLMKYRKLRLQDTKKSKEITIKEEDDDLLFTMSDMNLS